MLVPLLIHSAGVANYFYGIYFQLYLIDIPESVSKTRNAYGGAWKFLTFWNLWIQLAFHLSGLLNCLFGTSAATRSGSGFLQRTRDLLFATLAFPIGIFVGAMFWGLYHIDRDLIFPARYDKYIPAFENHVLHTTVLVLQLLELCVTYHVYPRRRSAGMTTTAVFCFVYLSWICYIAYAGGFWVYPVFKVLTPPMRIAFMAVCAGFGALFYLGGERLNFAIWGRHVEKRRLD